MNGFTYTATFQVDEERYPEIRTQAYNLLKEYGYSDQDAARAVESIEYCLNLILVVRINEEAGADVTLHPFSLGIEIEDEQVESYSMGESV